MRSEIAGVALGLVAAVSTGCATFQPGAGLPEVQDLVAARSPSLALRWDQGTAADDDVEARVKGLLSKPLTPAAAVQVALLRNRSIRAVYGQLGIAQADLVQAGLLQNPILTADVRFGLDGSGVGAAIGMVQEFVSILQIPLKKRVAAAAFEEAKLSVAAAVLDLAIQAKRSFYQLQGAAQMLELRQKVVEGSAVAADIAQRQHAAGNITDLELATENATYEQARVELAEAEAEVVDDRETLTAIMGLWGADTEWTVAARLPELPSEDPGVDGLEAQAVTQRLDLAAARQRMQVLAETRRLTKFYGVIPEASAGVESERELESGVWSLGPALSVALPLFDQRQAALANTDTQMRQSEDTHAALAVQIRSQVRRARARLFAARARAAHYRKTVVPLRQRVAQQTQLEFNGMLVGVFQLLQAKRDEVEAGRGYIAALRDYWIARTDLEAALGAEIPGMSGMHHDH